jgi:hypothetical protein
MLLRRFRLVQLPRRGTEDLLGSGVLEVEEVLSGYRAAPLPAVYSHNRQMPPRVRVLVDWVAEVLQRDGCAADFSAKREPGAFEYHSPIVAPIFG